MAQPIFIPAGVLDSTHVSDSIALFGWVVNNCLDPQRLCQAWGTLAIAWPILSARLCHDKSTHGWGYQLTSPPAAKANFTCSKVAGSIEDRCTLPRRTSGITATKASDLCHLFMPYAPRNVQDLLDEDMGLVRLHLTNFDHTSLVAVSVPHVLADAHGISVIMQGLVQILGGTSSLPALSHTDRFLRYSQKRNKVPAPLGWRTVTPSERKVLSSRNRASNPYGGDDQSYNVFFPKHEVENLRRQALKDIQTLSGESTSSQHVSSSEALIAFIVKCLYPLDVTTAPAEETLNIFYAVNMRNILSIPRDYIHNAVSMAVTPTLSTSEIPKRSLGELALHLRHAVTFQSRRERVESWITWMLQNKDEKKVFFDPVNGRGLIITNCRGLGLEAFDFSGALPANATAQARCTHMWHQMIQPSSQRDRIILWADQETSGVWMNGCFSRRVWEDESGIGRFRIRSEIAKL